MRGWKVSHGLVSTPFLDVADVGEALAGMVKRSFMLILAFVMGLVCTVPMVHILQLRTFSSCLLIFSKNILPPVPQTSLQQVPRGKMILENRAVTLAPP
jgi:hypothetical protein